MRTVAALLLGLAAPALVHAAFGFSTTSSPTSCGDFKVTWSGGSAPFSLSLYPAFAASVQMPIPADAFSNGQGSFTMQLPLNNSARFVAVMSDATGFASGGISPLINVGAAADGATCDRNLTPPWTWASNSAVQQCNPYIIDSIDPKTVSYPLTVLTLVPGGTSQNYSITSGTGFTIPHINVAAGSSLLVSLYDAAGRTGGDSDLNTVLQTGDPSCLSSALSSTAIASSTTPAGSSSALSTASATSTSAASKAGTISGGTIGAIAAAGIVGVGAMTAIGFFCWRRNRGSQRYARDRRRMDMGADYDSPTLLAATQHRYEPEPFTLGALGTEQGNWANASPNSSSDMMMPGAAAATAATSRYTDTAPPSRGASMYTGSTAPTSRSSKTNRTSSVGQPRFIVHTDAADELPEEPEDEVIELPPQYNESRRPTPAYGEGGAAGSSSSLPTGDVKRR